MKQSITLEPRSSLSADDLLFSRFLGYPVGRLERKIAVTIGAKALGHLGRELADLSLNASCIPVKQRGEYFFDYMEGQQMGKIPVSRVEDAIQKRLQAGATSFQASVSSVKWREVQLPDGLTRVQMSVQLTPLVQN